MDTDFETFQQHIIISNKLKKYVKSSWKAQPVLKGLLLD